MASSAAGGQNGTTLKKVLYMRQHSDVVRRYNPAKSSMDDDPIVKNGSGFGLKSNMVRLMCRKKQRLLTQAWEQWITTVKIVHDYTIDARIILSKTRGEDEPLDELEIEVLHKWIIQYKDEDPTGLSALLTSCRSKSAKMSALQNLRLEQFEPGELILCQNTLPRAEDGLFTILNGSCDVLQFPEGSMSLLNLGTYFKNRDWDAAKNVLSTARLINTMRAPTGFGELASLALIKRTASVRASPDQKILTELLVIPRKCLYSVLQASTLIGTDIHSTSEAIDFLRQSGLAMSSSSRELFRIACSMRKRVINRGQVLYTKNQVANCCYIVVSGEIIADTQYCPGEADYADDDYPYICSLPSNCYILSNGSLLGDEAFLGVNGHCSSVGGRYQSTASVISEVAVVFQIVGVGLDFLLEKLNSVRYSALAYMNISPWSVPITTADSNSVYTMFNSLRKCISESNPYRGVTHSLVEQKPLKISELGLPPHRGGHKSSSGGHSGGVSAEGSMISSATSKFGLRGGAHGHSQGGNGYVHSTTQNTNINTGRKRFGSADHNRSGTAPSMGAAAGTGGLVNASTGSLVGVGMPNGGSTVLGDDPSSGAGDTVLEVYAYLPNPVVQHALRIKRDLKNAEAIKIRAIAKDGILHDELKRRGEQSSEKSYMSTRLNAAQRMLEYNINAYKERCDGSNPDFHLDDDESVQSTAQNSHSERPVASSHYGVDFAIADDDDELGENGTESELSLSEDEDFAESLLGSSAAGGGSGSQLKLSKKATAHLCSTNILQHHALVEYNRKREAEKKRELAALALQAVSTNFAGANTVKRNARSTSLANSGNNSVSGMGSSSNSSVVSVGLTELNVRNHITTSLNGTNSASAVSPNNAGGKVAGGKVAGSSKPSSSMGRGKGKYGKEGGGAGTNNTNINKNSANNAAGGGAGDKSSKPNLKSAAQFFIRKRIPLRYTLTHEVELNAPSNNITGTLQIQRQESGALLVELDRTAEKMKLNKLAAKRAEAEAAAAAIDIESPREFMKLIRSKEFPNRKNKYREEKEWSTRYMKATDADCGSSTMVSMTVGGSDGYGNYLQDGMPPRNKSCLYLDTMTGRRRRKQTAAPCTDTVTGSGSLGLNTSGNTATTVGLVQPETQSTKVVASDSKLTGSGSGGSGSSGSETRKLSVTFAPVASGSSNNESTTVAVSDLEPPEEIARAFANRFSAGGGATLTDSEAGDGGGESSFNVSRMPSADAYTAEILAGGTAAGHVRFEQDQQQSGGAGSDSGVVVGTITPPRSRPSSRPNSRPSSPSTRRAGSPKTVINGGLVPVDISTPGGNASRPTTPTRSTSSAPGTPGVTGTPTAAAKKFGNDKHGNQLTLAQLNPGADALERLRVSCV